MQSQTLSADELIKAWSASDTSQTTKAESIYADLRMHLNAAAFSQRVRELDDYLKKHPSTRLEVRIILYETEGKFELNHTITSADVHRLKTAIILAGLLHDEQLLSEVYCAYAENTAGENQKIGMKLFYTLKAIDIQNRIGAAHFPWLCDRYFFVSRVMYITLNYRQCISYALQYLQLRKLQEAVRPRKTTALNPGDIYAFDLIGASYEALGMGDSVVYYYRKIQEALAAYAAHEQSHTFHYYLQPDSVFIELWTGIAAGGIGRGLFLQKKYDEAAPLLLQNIRSSLPMNQLPDAALAQNTLAQIQFIRHRQGGALRLWKQAFQWALTESDFQNKISILHNIANAYQALGIYDSAYFYSNRYHLYLDSLQDEINRTRLSDIRQRIEYENTQAFLKNAQNKIDAQQRQRDYMIIGIALLFIIGLLIFNRYRLRQKHFKKQAALQRQLAEIEIANAKTQIAAFRENLVEKDNLISRLKNELKENAGFKDNLDEKLNKYVLITEQGWESFRTEFIKAFPAFYHALHRALPSVTSSEERLAFLIYLRFGNEQIANATGIAGDSVARSKRRLKQRFNLPGDISLESFIASIG